MKTIKLNIQGNPYEVTIRSINGNVADVVVNGVSYKVEIDPKSNIASNTVITTPNPVLTPATEKPAEPVKEVVADLPSGGHKLAAPLPGIIVSVDVKPGDKIKLGQKLLVLEAMKMENNINSDVDGVVAKICVSKGDSVMEGDVLIEIAS